AHGPHHALGVAADQVQPHVVGLHDDDIERRLGVRRLQLVLLRAEHLEVERLGFAGAALAETTGGLRVVVGVAGHPLHLQRGVVEDEVEGLGAAVDVGVDPVRGHHVADDAVQVGAGLLAVVGTTGGQQRLVARDPDPAAGSGRRSAVVRCLLEDDDPQSVMGGGQGGGHACGAAADDHHVVAVWVKNRISHVEHVIEWTRRWSMLRGRRVVRRLIGRENLFQFGVECMGLDAVNPPDVTAADGAADLTADVVVIGFGAAGACAALEAAETGADVLVLERFRGGGTSALSDGIIYAGGGTTVQRAAGVRDTPEQMLAYLRREVGDAVSPQTLHRFVEQSPDMIDWLSGHGVPFDASLCPYKTSYPNDKYYLYYSGSEVSGYGREVAEPAQRGHRVKGRGTSGKKMTDPLIASALRHGVR